MKCLIYKFGVWWRANILSGVTWAHTDNPRQTKQTVWLPESLLQVPSHCVYIRLFQKKNGSNVPVRMKPFLPYFFCCDVIAPTYCLSAERLGAHRSVWKDKKNALLIKSGCFFTMRLLAKMRSRFRGSRAEKSRRRRGCCLLGIVTFCTTLHAHGESHPFTLPASCRLPPPLRYLPLMPWWGRWISHCCCWEPIERRSLLPKSTIAQRKRQLKTKHCIRVSPRLTTFSNGDLKSDSAIYVRKTAVILNVFPIAPDLASFSPLGIVNPFALAVVPPQYIYVVVNCAQ